MIKTFWIVAAIIAGAVAAPASASIYVVDYTGTITFGLDGTGLFGPPLTRYDGQSFEAALTYNTANPTYTFQNLERTGYVMVSSPSNPQITITVNNKSFTLPRASETIQTTTNNSSQGVVNIGLSADRFTGAINYQLSTTINSDTKLGGQNLFGSQSFNPVVNQNFGTAGDSGHGSFFANGYFTNFNITNVSTHVSGAPEPSTWAMMLVGLGLVGWTMRRRLATAQAPAFAAG